MRAGGLGEALIELGGQPTKFTIVADEDLAVGDRVVVISAESPTKLRVEAEDKFWGD